ncbi:uncharacterized protein OCT59_019830 [Rhizophagus irregularis]|uniref:Uncharacterized protein n=1 Tax=Rhizophagus irregularis (strain DAOM 197198w) TaxID=1432141 RepID=A0A015JKW2_RHIIW|nr:hypothetical protein RirG_110670 [Rhizophagus irregularis DAOM 197198w]EXX72448.1 hypothetical protein RirG_069280 [Rhizophagus irregularis DAOM 197198w]UZO27640.1 hypothetical protein OCT59_019830 [Rhizophagus irregularis]GBC25364.1 hypothetical protein GLOIN_2v1511284 [Rhizophagus irregularis DAOM 181602=DAOM 197198]
MKGLIDSTQRSDIYKVQSRCNRALKIYILKYLPKDILREEPDFLSIKSNDTILDYELCEECNIPILIEDPPRSLVLNVCVDMINQTCMKAMYKDGVLFCSCGVVDDNSDPLLPFQYSIIDYGSREKSRLKLFYQMGILPNGYFTE